MNELFQQFVADRLRRFLAPQLDLIEEPEVRWRSGSTDHAAGSGDAPGRRRSLRRGREVQARRGAGRMSDYYQLLAYTTAMRLPEGVLIYAQDPGDRNDPADRCGRSPAHPVHTVRIRNTSIDIHVYRLRLDGTKPGARRERRASWPSGF